MAGRKTKLTPDLQDRICKLIEAGNYDQTACQEAGIHVATFYRWMKDGEEAEGGIYSEFHEAVMCARARSEARLVASWTKAATKDWRAARDLLARRFPDRWKERTGQEHDGDINVKVTFDDGVVVEADDFVDP